ncbi:MAG TPA: PQQ-binding-like beta-propeller repeat protein [Tepidisphaeraceae bacterium]
MLRPSVGRAADPAPLPAFQGGGPLHGVAPDPIAPPPYQLRWQYKAGDDEKRASIENNPTIAGDTAYVADSAGTLHAINLADGKARWTYKTEGGFATTPLVLNGKIYLGDLDGFLHCIAADKGTKLWTFDSQGSIHSSANVSPDGKTIVFGNDNADVFAVDADTGHKVWEGRGGDRINACPAVGYDAAFFTGCDARLLALNLKDGTERFAVELGGLAPGSPALLEDRIIAATGEGAVLAWTPDGKKQLWKYDDVDQQQAMFYSSPAVADGIVVLGCRDRLVHAIDVKTGKRAWAFKTRGEVDATAVISAGRVYVPSKDKKLYVLDLKTGAKLWEFTAGRGVTAGPAIASNVIVFGDTAGNVYCLEQKK